MNPTVVDTPMSEALAIDSARPAPATEDTLAATGITRHGANDGSHDEARITKGTAVGRYIVVGQLGTGGMGVVYTAYDPQLERRVALKLLRRKTSAGTRARARLLREALALARLSHPNVVAVHDVGEHEGQVFLAMEFVEGQTLRKWLRAKERSVREVLGVLALAGRGLAAAHAKGIVHRDFKPDNVMVDDDGRVRVMDFGLARSEDGNTSLLDVSSSGSHDPPVADLSLTRAGATLGTPAYMAPEQHLRRPTNARTDQFSFCVTVYEAIYGERPFSGDSLAALSWSVTEGKLGPMPRGRRVPNRIERAVLRGLAKDPEERWPSLDELLDELTRDPGPMRRRFMTAGVVIGVLGTVVGWRFVERARIGAACEREGRAITEVWNAERKATIGTTLKNTGVAYAGDSWQRASSHLDAYTEQWTTLRTDACLRTEIDGAWPPPMLNRARECFDERRARLATLLEGFEEADAAVLPRVLSVVMRLAPVTECTNATWLARRPATPEDLPAREQTAALRRRLAEVGALASTGHYGDAIERAETIASEAASIDSMPLVAEARLAVGLGLERQGNYERALEELTQAYLIAGGAGHDIASLKAATRLSFVTGYQLARTEEGLRWAAIAEMLVTRLGLGDEPAVSEWLTNLGSVHQAQGKYDEALKAQQRALEVAERVYSEGHPRLAAMWINLANAHYGRGDYGKAVEANEKALAIYEASLGPFHPDLAMALLNLGVARHSRGELEEAIASFERALEIQTAAFGDRHPILARTLNNLGAMHYKRHDDAKAQAAYQRALEIQRETLGEDHHDLAGSYNNLGRVQARQGDPEAALTSYERALAIRLEALGPDHPHVARVYSSMGLTHRARGAFADAIEAHEKALAIWEGAFDGDHPKVGTALSDLGMARLDAEDFEEAVRVLERALKIRVAAEKRKEKIGETRFALARAIEGAGGDKARALALAREARGELRDGEPEELAKLDAWLAERG